MNRYERLNQERKFIDVKKRVAAYCRVSTDNEDQANSFESQQRYFRQYIERNPDWELYEIFADEGISGTNTKKRKEFNRMIACAKNGDFDLIITKEISRFARNTLDSIYYTRDLKKHGVGVIFMNDNINTLDGDAELRLAIMSSIAQEESRKTSERVKWGQKRQMEQGVVFGRSMLGYDVEGGKMTINEEGAKVVRLIFHKFVNEGKGTHVIARELREEGINPMRVKEWSNTVILRVIRNEKYCGDLVQKKTYTPDFLSHEKKYNRGQEEFVIIKDHHEPIISRELFDEANRILDAKSLSQEGKAKHSNRYPFSGKIKCGCCGSSYVARYKSRKDGSRYKAWRCHEAAKHGSPHIDKAGNQVGCTGLSIRNEDATHIMYLVTKELKYNREKITNNLISIIKSIIAMDTTGTDVEKLKSQIKTIEDKRTKLIDIYMSGDITKEEFTAARSKCDAEIAQLQSVIDSIDKQQAMIKQQQELVREISEAINEIVGGVEYEDDFYKQLLDKMVVIDKDNIDVYLNLLPIKWSYTVAKASKKAVASEWNISEASLPIDVTMDIPENIRGNNRRYKVVRYHNGTAEELETKVMNNGKSIRFATNKFSTYAIVYEEIVKQDFDMSQVRWDYTEEFTYDGEEKTVQLVGLPDGLVAEYDNTNKGTEIGNYTTSVTFQYDTTLYNAPSAVESLNWSIVAASPQKQDFDMSNVKWDYTTAFTYDGTAKTVTLTGLPAGLTANYTGNTATEVGNYVASVSFTYDTEVYNMPTQVANLNWSIVAPPAPPAPAKSDFDMSNVKWDYATAFTYDGTAKTVALTGLPSGLTATYSGNTATDAGVYTATVVFSYDAEKYNAPKAIDALTWTINKADAAVKVSKVSITKTYGDKAFSLGVTAAKGTKVAYKSSDTKVVKVSTTGKVTIKGCGQATITITASGANFETSQKKVTVTVKPKKVSIKKLTSPKKKSIKITWAKDSMVTGYEIEYSTNKKFTKKTTKKVTISKYKTISKTIGKLKSKKKYYVRIRAYKKSGKTKIYGAWSTVKNIKVK